MSTTARKARKRENNLLRADGWYELVVPFRHTPKVGTPVTLRHENQPRPIFGKGTHNAPTRHGVTSRTLRRIKNYVSPETANFREGTARPEQAAAVDVKLDEKPYRVGRKRYSIYDVLNRFHQDKDENAEAIWAPRKGFAQDMAAYNHDGVVPPVQAL